MILLNVSPYCCPDPLATRHQAFWNLAYRGRSWQELQWCMGLEPRVAMEKIKEDKKQRQDVLWALNHVTIFLDKEIQSIPFPKYLQIDVLRNLEMFRFQNGNNTFWHITAYRTVARSLQSLTVTNRNYKYHTLPIESVRTHPTFQTNDFWGVGGSADEWLPPSRARGITAGHLETHLLCWCHAGGKQRDDWEHVLQGVDHCHKCHHRHGECIVVSRL